MTFWSSQTLRLKLPADSLIVPYDPSRVVHAAYELGVGSEAFVTSNLADDTVLPRGKKIVIPPGQFGLLVTRETIRVPPSAIAFISIRAGIKFQGLVNVSGFHVDPGYHGQLRFSVYNAGSHSIVLDQDQRVFMIWFANLDHEDDNPYPVRPHSALAITSKDVTKIYGEVASPAELKKQLEELKTDLDKKFHASEQTRLFNRSWIMLIVGILIALGVDVLRSYVGHH
ncbi:MAG: dCTP deaminase domain-containing protein [Gemmatimonadaceae bacterium]